MKMRKIFIRLLWVLS